MSQIISRCALQCALVAALLLCVMALAAEPELTVVRNGKTDAVIVLAPEAATPAKTAKGEIIDPWDYNQLTNSKRNAEYLAATDLAKYIGLMTGATPRIAGTREEIDAALKGKAPVFLIGEEALAAKPDWAKRIMAAAKQNPVLGADAVGMLREGNRIYLAGNNLWAHYFAVSALLQQWGCRWYLQTDFGECIPETPTLKIGKLDTVYAPPFEVRTYGLFWYGDVAGYNDFVRRNYMMAYDGRVVPAGHALEKYVGALIPPGKSAFNVPIADEKTAVHIANQLADGYGKGQSYSISMDDGMYASDSPVDKALSALQYDKYFMRPAMSDNFMVLYNGIAKILQTKYPDSKARLGFLAYSNMTLPPVKPVKAEPSLVTYLAPIDIDPNHGMDSVQSPPRREYQNMMEGWSKVMDGRVIIYDYDQGMLVWRDIPNPSHQAFRQDVKHYRDAGILGIATESRGGAGTVFLNLYLRGQLMWNPDVDIDALLDEFYPNFYGPAAEPMRAYWTAIYHSWENTIVTEHEFFVIPAIYTPDVVETMRVSLEKAEALVAPLRAKKEPTWREKRILDRMDFTRMSYEITANYVAMLHAAATECDYKTAVDFGEKGLAAREKMTDTSGTFTSYRGMLQSEGTGIQSPWWPGEVRRVYLPLQGYLDGTKGTLLMKLPLEWAFRRDPDDQGLKDGWGVKAPDLTFWNANKANYTLDTRKDYPVTEWEGVRADLYLQAQGVRRPDRQSELGHGWYATEIELTAEQAKKARLMFTGLFNECWLYVNGKEVAHRENYQPIWWINDYTFFWDVDLTGKLQPGKNLISLRLYNPHHFAGMFRRPFLYAPKGT